MLCKFSCTTSYGSEFFTNTGILYKHGILLLLLLLLLLYVLFFDEEDRHGYDEEEDYYVTLFAFWGILDSCTWYNSLLRNPQKAPLGV